MDSGDLALRWASSLRFSRSFSSSICCSSRASRSGSGSAVTSGALGRLGASGASSAQAGPAQVSRMAMAVVLMAVFMLARGLPQSFVSVPGNSCPLGLLVATAHQLQHGLLDAEGDRRGLHGLIARVKRERPLAP